MNFLSWAEKKRRGAVVAAIDTNRTEAGLLAFSHSLVIESSGNLIK